MNDEHLSKRELVKNLLLAATGVGLSAAVLQRAAAQPKPTAGPPETPVAPTPIPQGGISRPSTTDRGAAPAKSAASTPKK